MGSSAMSEPRVMAMCLTADRPQFINRAIACFAAQIYQSKALMIYDTGAKAADIVQRNGIFHEYHPEDRGLTVGALRNLAMAFAHPMCLNADIIVHWDSDDWSHPNRIAEQVALLQQSGADCVGYNELLFWKSASGPMDIDPMERSMPVHPGEAWLYSLPRVNYALGTSLCYWRKTWEAKPFEDTRAGEDLRFIDGLDVWSVSGLPIVGNGQPRLVASVHGGNTHLRIDPQLTEPEHLRQWKRVPEWDERLREIMAL
jgi:glycosyltransferase involved in cell wall biosynthesis